MGGRVDRRCPERPGADHHSSNSSCPLVGRPSFWVVSSWFLLGAHSTDNRSGSVLSKMQILFWANSKVKISSNSFIAAPSPGKAPSEMAPHQVIGGVLSTQQGLRGHLTFQGVPRAAKMACLFCTLTPHPRRSRVYTQRVNRLGGRFELCRKEYRGEGRSQVRTRG